MAGTRGEDAAGAGLCMLPAGSVTAPALRAVSRFADSRGIPASWEFLPTLHASRSVPIVLRPRADYPVLAWLGAIGRLSLTLIPPALVGLAAADAAAGGGGGRGRGRGTGRFRPPSPHF